jgi:hypothetical protein
MSGPVVVAVIDPDGGLRRMGVAGDAVEQLVAEVTGTPVVEVTLHSQLVAWHGDAGGECNVVAAALGRTFGQDLVVSGPVVVAGGRDGCGVARGLTGEQLAGLAAVCRFWSQRAATVPTPGALAARERG